MAKGEGWQQISKRLAPVNTSSRPYAHRLKEVAYLALPSTHPLFYPVLRVRKTLLPFSLFGLETLAKEQGWQLGSSYLVTFFKARALDRKTFLFPLIPDCPFQVPLGKQWKGRCVLRGLWYLISAGERWLTDILETTNSKEAGTKPALLKAEAGTWALLSFLLTLSSPHSYLWPILLIMATYSGNGRPKKPLSPSLVTRNLFL